MFCIAWKAAMFFRKFAVVVISLVPTLICAGLTLLLTAFLLGANAGCVRFVGVLSGVSIPCEVVYVPLIILTLGIGFSSVVLSYKATISWGRNKFGIPVKEKPSKPLRTPKHRTARRGTIVYVAAIIIVVGIISAVVIPQIYSSKEQARHSENPAISPSDK